MSLGDEIAILHVISMPLEGAGETYYSEFKRIKQDIASKILESTVNLLKPSNIKISTSIINGYPDKGIIESAKDLNTDLIVIGSGGFKGIKAVLLGSVARSVVINSSKPVLVVKPPQWSLSDNLRILFATDGSQYAEEAGRLLTVMPFGSNTEITIFHVIQSVLDIPKKFHIEIDKKIREVATEIRSYQINESEKFLKQAYELLSIRFSKINTVTKEGDPLIEIMNAAKSFKTDIIVVGSKGMKGLKGMLGSVSRYLLSRSECSILIEKAM
ncbi:MAG: universal stress protein [Thermodesulfovibrionales bacterium]